MGLIERVEEDGSSKMAILSDIQGMEDFLGDMDFKVTGTEVGVTAIQMDIKVHGLSREILEKAAKRQKKAECILWSRCLKKFRDREKSCPSMRREASRCVSILTRSES